MRPGGGEPRYAVSDCCSRIHVSTCPAQFGAPCQGLAPAEVSRIPWGFCWYIQLYSLSLDTGNHSTPARAMETASAGAWETPASGHAADRGRAGNDGREVTCLSGFFDLPGDVFVRVKLPGITGFCGTAQSNLVRSFFRRSSRTRSRSTCTSSSASVGRHPQAWLAAHAPRDRRLFSYEDLSGEPLEWKVTGPVGRNCKLSPAGIVFRFPNWTSKMTVSRFAYSISTRHGAALSGRESMILRENTVPAPTMAGEAACGSRLSRKETSNDCRSRTAVDTRSERACPLVPTIVPPIWSSSSGSPPIRSAARLNPFVAVTPADVESTGESAVPVRGITQNFAIASATILKCS